MAGGWLSGLGAALSVGGRTYSNERKYQEEEARKREQEALQMALLKEQIDAAQTNHAQDIEKFGIDNAKSLVNSLDEGSLVKDLPYGVAGTGGENFFQKDKTLGASQLALNPAMFTGTPQDVKPGAMGRTEQTPQQTSGQDMTALAPFLQGKETGNGYRTVLPIDSKAALRAQQDAARLAQIQTEWYNRNLLGAGHDSTLRDIASGHDASRERAVQIRVDGSGGADPYKLDMAATRMGNQFAKLRDPITKSELALAEIEAAVEDVLQGRRMASDQAVITAFNKITDPGSVVRESEYARTPENAALIQRLWGGLQRVTKGGSGLLPQNLVEIRDTARKLVSASRNQFNSKYRPQFSKRAAAMGIPEDLIFPVDPTDAVPVPTQQGPGGPKRTVVTLDDLRK